MQRLTVYLCLIFLCVVNVFAVQQKNEWRKKEQFVIIPPEQVLVTIASQPDCPLKFENVRNIMRLEGGSLVDYQIRNRSAKPVRSFMAGWWTTANSGALSAWPSKANAGLLMPNESTPADEEIMRGEILPLTGTLREKFGLQGQMKGIVVLMVVQVTFADGTTYSDGAAFKALQAHSANLAGFDEETHLRE